MQNSEMRQLAAIMFTDLVGYSTLMHKNESLAFELLHEHRAIVRKFLRQYRGTEIDTAGDGFFVKFTSALDAVTCGFEIQTAFADRNRNSAPDRKIVLRIGIHVSDILETDRDSKTGVYGDGVNIAARLQPLAPKGGICISSAVYEHLRGRLDAPISYMGRPKLKGIKRPFKLYAIEVRPPSLATRIMRETRIFKSRTFLRRAALSTAFGCLVAAFVISHYNYERSDRPRVAVLPFDTVGLNETEAYIPDGIVGGMISTLSKDGVRVLAKNSVMSLKKERKTPREIGVELGIDRVVVGALIKSGDSMKVSVSLVDTLSQEVLWSEDFESSSNDLLTLKNNITNSLVARFTPTRSIASVPRTIETPESPEKKEAYLAFLKGQFEMSRRTKESFHNATVELNKAIALDPSFAPAYAELATASSLEAWYGVKPPVEGAIKILQYANKALTLDPSSTEALLILAEEKIYLENDFSKADELYRHAIDSNPRHAMTHQWYAEYLAYAGRTQESFEEADKAYELDPLNPVVSSSRGLMRYLAHDYSSAQEYLEKAMSLDESLMLNYYWLGRIHVAKKEYSKAIALLKKAVEMSGHEPMAVAALAYACAKSGDIQHALDLKGDLLAEANERYVSPYFLAKIETALGHQDEAIQLLQKSVIEHGNQTVAALVDPEFDELRSNPAFTKALAGLKK